MYESQSLTERIVDFAYLWDGTEHGWRLLRVGEEEVNRVHPFGICNVVDRSVLTISDGQLHNAVVEEFSRNGGRVIDKLPPLGK